MSVGGAEENVSPVFAGDRNVDDGVERERVGVGCGPRCLRELESGVAQRQIRKEKVSAQPQIFVRVASRARRCYKTSTTYVGARCATVQIRSGANVEGPGLARGGTFLAQPRSGLLMRRFLAPRGRRCRGRLCRGLLCRRCG